MAKIFLDTDVCIDIILHRKPFFEVTDKVLEFARKRRFSIVMSEGSIPNVIYVLTERYKISNINDRLTMWLKMCHVVSSNNQVIIHSLNSGFIDKEDAYQYFTAQHNEVDSFITRNKNDYFPFASSIPVYTPLEFLEINQQS